MLTTPMFQNAQTVLRELRDNLWLDRHTRAVFLEFTLYAPNAHVFTYVSLLAEFSDSGGVLPFTR